jgi:hypothetical protein
VLYSETTRFADLEEFDDVKVCVENLHQNLTDHGILASYFQTHFKTSDCLCLHAAVVLLQDEDEDIRVLQNVSNYLPPDTA